MVFPRSLRSSRSDSSFSNASRYVSAASSPALPADLEPPPMNPEKSPLKLFTAAFQTSLYLSKMLCISPSETPDSSAFATALEIAADVLRLIAAVSASSFSTALLDASAFWLVACSDFCFASASISTAAAAFNFALNSISCAATRLS